MSVKVKTTGKIEINANAMLDLATTLAVGIIQRRTAKGLEIDGSAMASYSPLYAMQLRSVGENGAVDLTRSGAYLSSIKELSRTVDANGVARAVIGPGTGTSPTKHLPPPYVFDDEKTPAQREKALAAWKSSPKKPGRSPPHNVLGAILSEKRPHLGLSPEECKRMAAQMIKVGLKQRR